MSTELMERVGWTSGPNTRGTLDIIWATLVTLGLCVWTAVHPNIQLRSSLRHDLGIRILMMVVAVIFPEILISAAWQQRALADSLAAPITQRLLKHTEETAESSTRISENFTETSEGSTDTPNKVSTVDLSHEQAFFVVMGGFAFEHTVLDEKKVARQIRSILTTEGFELLRHIEYTPRLTKADVEERSNADVIAKLIVVFQVVWFAIQVAARFASDLTVTALEVHTIVHVGCAIIMYILWWNKPYAINRSVLLQDEDERKIGDLFLFDHVRREKHREIVKKHEAKRREYWEFRAFANNQDLIDHDIPPVSPQMESIEQTLKTYNSDEIGSHSTHEFEILLRSLAKTAYAGLQCILDRERPFPNRNPKALSMLERPIWRGVRRTANNFTLRQVWGSWTVSTGHEMSIPKLMHFLFNLLYGAGHLAAWNSTTFPSEIEAWLWRGSGLIVASLFTYGTIWVLFWMGVGSKSKSKWLLAVVRGDINIIMGPFFSAVILMYFGARCYFLVESLISLRSLPQSAYDNVQWTSFLPHSC